MNDETTMPLEEPTDLDAARRDVARAEERLSSRWRAAKVAGEKSVGRALSVARPVLIGAAVVGGVVWIVSSVVGKRRGRYRYGAPPTRSSLLGEMTRAAALALASAAAHRVADHYLAVPGSRESLQGLPSKAGG
jgi:hypothetical protein